MRPFFTFRQVAALLCRAILLACMCLVMPAPAPASGHGPEQKPSVLRVGYFLTPPHAYVLPSGQAAGAAVDLLTKHIAPLMGMPIELVGPFPFARLIHDFDSRKLDGILVLSRTPEREHIFQYPARPFWQLTASLAVLENHPLKEYTPATSLKRMRIGSIVGVWTPKELLASGARFDPTTGDFATLLNLQKLINGRVEAVYCPDAATLKETIR
ncbi:MAG: substrate-binding periplasmic protein, partial [Halodesulfovibrio sp.]